MYKEYRFPIKKAHQAALKQYELKKEFGYKIPIYKIELSNKEFPSMPTEKEFLSIVLPVGLVPNPKRRKQF